jgi:hypothetical protein
MFINKVRACINVFRRDDFQRDAAPGIGMTLETHVGDQSTSACDRFLQPSGTDCLALLPPARLSGANLGLVCGKRSR